MPNKPVMKYGLLLAGGVILCAALLHGYGSLEIPADAGKEIFVRDARLQTPSQLPDIGLSILKTGETTTLDALFVSGGSWTQKRKGAHAAILIRHPHGNFLFDSGLGNQIDAQYRAAMPFWLKPFMHYDKLQSAQAILATSPQPLKIDSIILSHLHWDHASGIKDFPNAEICTTQSEYELAMKPDTPERAFIKSQYDGDKIKWHFIRFSSMPYENFSQSLDFFGDGSIVLVPLPGHTPGATGMFVNFRSGKRMFFTGDTTWAAEGFTQPAEKFWAARWLVDDDREATAHTILQVHSLMQQYPGLIVVPAHDENVQGKLGFYPAVIQ